MHSLRFLTSLKSASSSLSNLYPKIIYHINQFKESASPKVSNVLVVVEFLV